MQYLYETHLHTEESSFCGCIKGVEVARLYKEAGYSGIIITDHFNKNTFNRAKLTDWNDMVDFNMAGYKAAKTLEDDNFKVMYGIEIRFENDNDNDYLCYGVDEKYLKAHPFLTEIDDYDDFYAMAKEDGLTVFQAHPFRNHISVTPPSLIDGIEVFNGNVRHDSRCETALSWAIKFNLPFLSGSDCHKPEDLARGGIITEHKINDISGFIDTVKKRNYSIKYSFCNY